MTLLITSLFTILFQFNILSSLSFLFTDYSKLHPSKHRSLYSPQLLNYVVSSKSSQRHVPLYNSNDSTQFEKVTKSNTITLENPETKAKSNTITLEKWRVVLHNDEVHTFNYVIEALIKTVGTIDRK